MPPRTWALFAYCVMSVPLLLNCFLFVEINRSLGMISFASSCEVFMPPRTWTLFAKVDGDWNVTAV